MSSFQTKRPRYLCAMVALLLAVGATSSAFGQVVKLRVDGDQGLATPASPEGDDWDNAFKYLQDAISHANSLLGGQDPPHRVEIWVAATDSSNPYRPDQSAANEPGSRQRTASFLLRVVRVRRQQH